MPQLRPRKHRPIVLNISPDDESPLQLAAMVYALRDAHVELFMKVTNRPAEQVETFIDDMYERYLEDLVGQVKAYREANP